MKAVSFLIFLSSLLIAVCPSQAMAGTWELSLGLSYNRTNYSATSYAWMRRYGLSLGYNFSNQSEIEFSFQDVIDRTFIQNYEDTTLHDRIWGFNWNQYFLGRNAPVQPYVKLGAGQLNRNATGSYATGASTTPEVDSLTIIVGLGLRIYLTRTFAIRSEVTSYLTGNTLSEYINSHKDNMAATIGISLFL